METGKDIDVLCKFLFNVLVFTFLDQLPLLLFVFVTNKWLSMMDYLSDDLLCHILSFSTIDVSHKTALSLVCRRWRQCLEDPASWRRSRKEVRVINSVVKLRIGTSLIIPKFESKDVVYKFQKVLDDLRPFGVDIRSRGKVTDQLIIALKARHTKLNLIYLSISQFRMKTHVYPFYAQEQNRLIPDLIGLYSSTLISLRVCILNKEIVRAIGSCHYLQRLFALAANVWPTKFGDIAAEEELLSSFQNKIIHTLRLGTQPSLTLISLDFVCRSLPSLRHLSLSLGYIPTKHFISNLHRVIRHRLISLSLDLPSVRDGIYLRKIPERFPNLTRLYVIKYSPDLSSKVSTKDVRSLLEEMIKNYGQRNTKKNEILVSLWASDDEEEIEMDLMMKGLVDWIKYEKKEIYLHKEKLTIILDTTAVIYEFCSY